MKKYGMLLIILVLLAMMLLSGCDKKERGEEQILIEKKLSLALDLGFIGFPPLSIDRREIKNNEKEFKRIALYGSLSEAQEKENKTLDELNKCEDEIIAVASTVVNSRIERLNEIIVRDNLNDNLKEKGIDYPVTMDDVLTKTAELCDFIYNDDVVMKKNFTSITYVYK